MQQNQEVLRMENITKTFPGVKALQDVSLTVRRGTVHALMGENGAGKSTLMKCLFGVYKKDGGRIFLDGKEVDFKNSASALENGVPWSIRSLIRHSSEVSAKTCGWDVCHYGTSFFLLLRKRR